MAVINTVWKLIEATFPFHIDLTQSTLVDGQNFVADGDMVKSGPSSYNVNNGKSYGYIKIHTPKTDSKIRLRFDFRISSESVDWGAALVADKAIKPTIDEVKNATRTDCLYVFCGSTAYKEDFQHLTVVLRPDKDYYVNFAYLKDYSGNKYDDRIYIRNMYIEEYTGVIRPGKDMNNARINQIYPEYRTMTSFDYNGSAFELYDPGHSMFKDCEAMTKVPWIYPQKHYIRAYFQNCKALTEVPALDTSNCDDFCNTFINCRKVISFPAYNMEKVKTMEYAFAGCWAMKTLGDTEGLVKINAPNCLYAKGMFQNSNSFTKADLNLSETVDAGRMFEGASAVTAIDFHGKTHKSRNLYSIFYKCENLATINGKFDVTNATRYTDGLAFALFGCSKLTVDPLIGTAPSVIKNLKSMYYGCWSLKKVNVDFSKAVNVTNHQYMFTNCQALSEVPYIPTSKSTTMFEMFAGCKNISQSGGFPYVLDISSIPNADALKGLFRDSCIKTVFFKNVKSDDVKQKIDSGAIIEVIWGQSGDYKVYNFDQGHEIPPYDGLASAEFYNGGLKDFEIIDANDWNLSKRGNGGRNLFQGMSKLRQIDNLDTSKFSDMRDMFNGCTNLPEAMTIDCAGIIEAAKLQGIFCCSSVKKVTLNKVVSWMASDIKKEVIWSGAVPDGVELTINTYN